MKIKENIPETLDEKIIGMGKSNYIPGCVPITFFMEANVGNFKHSAELIIDIDQKQMLVPNPSGMLPKLIPADQVYEKLIWRLFGFKNRIQFYNFIIEESRKKLIADWS